MYIFLWPLLNKRLKSLNLDELTSTKMYSIMISRVQSKSFFNIYSKKLFNDHIDRTSIYMLPCLNTYNAYMPCFNSKILNNVLFIPVYIYFYFILSEWDHLHCIFFVIYATKRLFIYFMKVTVVAVDCET